MFEKLKRRAFERSLIDPSFFRNVVRRAAYIAAHGDPERVHEMALSALNKYEDVIIGHSTEFRYSGLRVSLMPRNATNTTVNPLRFVMPFGTAAGLDKNGDALLPFSHIFGFEEPGTVILNHGTENDRHRIYADSRNDDLYNAQGFPSKGLDYFLKKVREYRGDAPLLISICGIPPESGRLNAAYEELGILLNELDAYAGGFVWNPFSPNTTTLTALRTPAEFRKNAELIVKKSGNDKLKLVKMGPYDDDKEKRREWLNLVDAWMEGGGDGIVAVNTYMVPRERVPAKRWGYPSAGCSGRFLQPYRQRAIADARFSFPEAVIIATGGIDSGEQAWMSFEAGANALEGYTPYTFNGFGLIIEMARGIRQKLKEQGCKTLAEYQADSRNGRKGM